MNNFIYTLSLHNRTLSLTREGLGFIVLLFGVGLGAINTGNNLLYLVLAMCCSFIAVSGVLSELSFKKLSVEANGPAHIYCNETGTLDFKITNNKVWAPSFSIRILLPSDGRCSLEQPPYFFFIPTGVTLEKSALFSGNKRGPLQITSCRLATSFPFGFYYKTKTIPLSIDMVIFPALHPVQLPPKNESRQEGEGTLQTRGEELYAVREFRPGDTLSSVHWKSSAKTGNLRVKEFQSTNEQSYTIFLNVKEPGSNKTVEVLEERVSKAASLIYHLIERGNEVSLKTEDMQTEFGKSETHLRELMYILAFIGLDEG
jgi:uncharacterized protein (DUF58 family)